jgi:hypothetical protein
MQNLRVVTTSDILGSLVKTATPFRGYDPHFDNNSESKEM